MKSSPLREGDGDSLPGRHPGGEKPSRQSVSQHQALSKTGVRVTSYGPSKGMADDPDSGQVSWGDDTYTFSHNLCGPDFKLK